MKECMHKPTPRKLGNAVSNSAEVRGVGELPKAILGGKNVQREPEREAYLAVRAPRSSLLPGGAPTIHEDMRTRVRLGVGSTDAR